jgi:release factor glutamine methyltransferase
MPKTYNELYLDARRVLRSHGVEAAQLEARELLSYASGKTREQFYRDLPLYPGDHVERRMKELMDRRLAGEPVAYIIGEWEFYGLTLDISPDVLVPRSDTETLVDQAIEYVRQLPDGARVLDLCAGSGCIGLAIAANCPNSQVILGDISDSALRVCRQNVRRCGLSSKVICMNINALEPPISALWDFDLIVSYPPYIPSGDIPDLDLSVRDYEPHLALDGGEDGLDFYRSITGKWKNSLRLGGMLMFEVGYDQADSVEKLFAANGYEDIKTFQDGGGIWRVVEATLNT